jgi:hypothetical protein
MVEHTKAELLYFELRAELKKLPSSLNKSAAIGCLDACGRLFSLAERDAAMEESDNETIEVFRHLAGMPQESKVFATDGDNNSNT